MKILYEDDKVIIVDNNFDRISLIRKDWLCDHNEKYVGTFIDTHDIQPITGCLGHAHPIVIKVKYIINTRKQGDDNG